MLNNRAQHRFFYHSLSHTILFSFYLYTKSRLFYSLWQCAYIRIHTRTFIAIQNFFHIHTHAYITLPRRALDKNHIHLPFFLHMYTGCTSIDGHIRSWWRTNPKLDLDPVKPRCRRRWSLEQSSCRAREEREREKERESNQIGALVMLPLLRKPGATAAATALRSTIINISSNKSLESLKTKWEREESEARVCEVARWVKPSAVTDKRASVSRVLVRRRANKK